MPESLKSAAEKASRATLLEEADFVGVGGAGGSIGWGRR
jgi:hypothetical protein